VPDEDPVFVVPFHCLPADPDNGGSRCPGADHHLYGKAVRIGALNFALLARALDAVVTVPDDALPEAMRFLLDRQKLVTEPSGAITVAALLRGLVDARGDTVCVVSGGNMFASGSRGDGGRLTLDDIEAITAEVPAVEVWDPMQIQNDAHVRRGEASTTVRIVGQSERAARVWVREVVRGLYGRGRHNRLTEVRLELSPAPGAGTSTSTI